MKNTIQMNGFEIYLLNDFCVDNKNNCITLNHTRNLFRDGIYSLKDDSQFIYSNYRKGHNEMMFGGMDETSLFLTELQNKPFEIFLKKGENAFYESLVPKVIKKWSKKIGTAYGRQGDWFFTPLKLKDKRDLIKFVLHITMNHPRQKNPRFRKSEFGIYEYAKTLLDTRHKLEIMPNSEKYQIIEFPWSMFVVMGKLSAPNHKDVILDEPYLLAQANYLVNPKTAD